MLPGHNHDPLLLLRKKRFGLGFLHCMILWETSLDQVWYFCIGQNSSAVIRKVIYLDFLAYMLLLFHSTQKCSSNLKNSPNSLETSIFPTASNLPSLDSDYNTGRVKCNKMRATFPTL